MLRWFWHIAGSNVLMYGPIEAADEAALREIARRFLGVRRLPKGFECWQTGFC